MKLSAFDANAMNVLIKDLRDTAEKFVRLGDSGAISFEMIAFMRYAGQGWEIPVTLGDKPFTAADSDVLKRDFQDSYARFFGRAIDGLEDVEIEIVTISVKAQGARTSPARIAINAGKGSIDASQRRDVFDPSTGGFLDTGIIERTSLVSGTKISGPAIIVENETSTVVTSHFDAVMQGDGSLLLMRKEASR
jgi:N-methylhydantoinase A